MAVRIVKHAFEIIHLLTGEVSTHVNINTHFKLYELRIASGGIDKFSWYT
jgi:hypothetical protein